MQLSKEFQNKVKEAGFKLVELQEAFIIEEITPYMEDKILKVKLKVRLQEIKDFKSRVKLVLEDLQETFGKVGINLALYDLLEEKKKELGL